MYVSDTKPRRTLGDVLTDLVPLVTVVVPTVTVTAIIAWRLKDVKVLDQGLKNLAVDTKALADKIDTQNARLDAHISKTAQQFDAQNARLDAHISQTAQQFAAQTARSDANMAQIAQQFSAMNAQFAANNAQFCAINARADKLYEELRETIAQMKKH